jgi:hypothetical protein
MILASGVSEVRFDEAASFLVIRCLWFGQRDCDVVLVAGKDLFAGVAAAVVNDLQFIDTKRFLASLDMRAS